MSTKGKQFYFSPEALASIQLIHSKLGLSQNTGMTPEVLTIKLALAALGDLMTHMQEGGKITFTRRSGLKFDYDPRKGLPKILKI